MACPSVRAASPAFSSPGMAAVHALPRAEEIEAPIFLHQLHRLIDHALQLVVVSELDEAGERKVLAQRMALEAVIGEEAPEIGMAREQDAVEVVGLALEPVGAPGTAPTMLGTGVCGVGLDAHADAVVQPRAQQVIDDVEALLAVGIVDAANVDQAAEAAERIVAQ